MKVIKQSWAFEDIIDSDYITKKIECAGRTCYKSEDKIKEESAEGLIKGLIKSGHHSVIEHHSISARIITDRGVTHEVVRHRIASYSQESTRYCNYSDDKFNNEITYILPVWFYGTHEIYKDVPKENRTAVYSHNASLEKESRECISYFLWRDSCEHAEKTYFELIKYGQTSQQARAQQARAVLPNSLKTELFMTYNLREWRHFFNLRADKKAHPQLRELALSMLQGFNEKLPVFFSDILEEKLKQ